MLRALRVLRVLRVLTFVPAMRKIVGALIQSLNGMLSIAMVLALIYYVAAVMATKLFGATFPDWFGTIAKSAYSLFQIMTLESWSMGIVRPVMEVHEFAWLFFIPFIMVTTFAVVNLLVGLIVNSMQDAHQEESNEKTDNYRDEVLSRLIELETLIKSQNDARKG